jgi:polar amino acid transport system ATP-binding protein
VNVASAVKEPGIESVKAAAPTGRMPIVLEATEITKRLGPVTAVSEVSLSVAKGEVVVIIGPSGSGKSTLLRCLNHLERPDRGVVRLNGDLIGVSQTGHAMPDRVLRRQRARMGMVFQRFNLFPHLTALQNVAIGPERTLRLRRSEGEIRAIALLRRFGLGDRATSFPSELSGGQRQRVAIARALAMEPEVLLFDEPTSSLDPEVVHEVLDAIKELAREGATMVVVTHEIGFARAVADRILVMDGGVIIEHGPAHDVLTRPQHPRAQQFLTSLKAA